MGHSDRVTPEICVVVDTNMLMLLHEGIDVFQSVEELLAARVAFIVPRPVYEELSRIASQGKPRHRRAALFALRIMRERGIPVIDIPRPTGRVDDDIAIYAKEKKCLVATNDKALRKALRRLGVPDIHLRESEGVLEASFTPPIL